MPLDLNFLAGTYFIEDDGIRGNNRSQIRGADGTIFGTFEHPADTLRFLATEPGVDFIFNVADFLATAVVTVGNPDNAAVTPESIVVHSIRSDGFVTLASKGAITEGGSDTAADILANAIVFSAVSGVGTAGNALETETSFIEAETSTGGINLSNYGPLQIGNISSSVEGLDVSNSGNLIVTTTGFFLFNDTTGGVVVHGGDISGNVILSAIGSDSDMFATVDLPLINAAGGGITLNVGRDLAFGTSGSVFDNDVLATGDINIHVGRDFFLDGTANIQTSAFGGIFGGDIAITAGRNIALTDTSGGLQTIEAFLGDVVLTTGPGGTYTQDAEMNAVTSTGDIIINADQAALNDGGIVASSGQVTIRPVSPGRAIDLGNPVDPASALALSNAELGRIGAQSLSIGDMNSGPVSVNAALAFSFVNDVTVRSATEIFVNSTFFVQRNLTLRAGDDIFVSAAGGITSATGGLSLFVDDAQDDGGIGGNGSLSGGILVNTTVVLNGNLDADTLRGSAAADILMGNGGNDTLQGFGGADFLDGGIGADQMTGGLGDDEFIVDHAGDAVIEAVGEGNDTVKSDITHTLEDNVEDLTLTGSANINGTGNSLDNEITGNSGNNTLNGLAGADTLRGGLGNDIYVVDNVADVVTETGGGTDLVQSSAIFALGSAVENLTLTGGAAIDGTGNTLANILTGNGAANTLNGGGGADTMSGGLGNDIYVVDNVGDVLTEAGGGTDTVQSTITFTLGASFENLTLTGGGAIDGTGNTIANILTGNGAVNTLRGLGGNDTLDGGGGNDTMIGGLGNDTYIVGQSGDVTSEGAGEGTNLVQSSITFTLGANVEDLTLTGAANITGTGNAIVNTLLGNTGNNILDGKAGADTMKGSLGNDTYVVNNAGDVTTELAGQGTDTVQAAITFTLANQIENLTLTGAGNINGTGNTIVNTLLGNGGDNILDGKLGADTMEGGAGDDTYVVDNAGDIAKELVGQGTDTVTASKTYTIANNVENLTLTGASNISGTGNVLDNILTGNGADNTLSGLGGDDQIIGGSGDDDIFGGTGNDELTGGSGADKFRFDTALNAATNVDDLLGYSGANDTILLDRDIFTGIAANGVLAASAFVNGTSAGDANDRIIYNSATGNIFYDADGNGAGAQIRFAIVADGTSLTSADFSAYL